MNEDASEFDKNGFFTSEKVTHFNCEILKSTLCNFLKTKSVLDLGCGDGFYIKHLEPVCLKVQGYDGNPYTKKLTGGLGDSSDLSQVQNFYKYDWVISFETGEHIPVEFEGNFINNLCRHAKEGIILSWASIDQEGQPQPGTGHVNCRPNSYLIEKMYEKSFLCDYNRTNFFRHKMDLWWLKFNLMVFYKVDSLII